MPQRGERCQARNEHAMAPGPLHKRPSLIAHTRTFERREENDQLFDRNIMERTGSVFCELVVASTSR